VGRRIMPNQKNIIIKYLQNFSVGVFCYKPGRRQDFEENRVIMLKILAPNFVYFKRIDNLILHIKPSSFN